MFRAKWGMFFFFFQTCQREVTGPQDVDTTEDKGNRVLPAMHLWVPLLPLQKALPTSLKEAAESGKKDFWGHLTACVQSCDAQLISHTHDLKVIAQF